MLGMFKDTVRVCVQLALCQNSKDTLELCISSFRHEAKCLLQL